MRIGIVGGTGGMGEGFALRWCAKHDVVVGSREAQKAVEAAANYTKAAEQAYGSGTMAGSINGDDNISFKMDPHRPPATGEKVKAMVELDRLNPHRGSATNAMALFLTVNTSGVTLLATGVFVMRRELGSHDPGIIFFTSLFATSCSTIVGTLMCLFLQRFFPAPPATDPIDTSAVSRQATTAR